MKTIFSPLSNILNRLPYAKKFILIGIILILPLAVILSLFIAELNPGIAFTKKERAGLEYIVELRRLLENVQQHRGLSNAFLSGDTHFLGQALNEQLQIKDNFEKIGAMDIKHGKSLSTAEKWAAVRASIEELMMTVLNLSIKDNFNTHTAITAEIISLINYVGDTSSLILDPEIDSYYLMDEIVTRIPLHTENMGRARGLGTGIAVRKTIDHEERQKLATLYSFIMESFDMSRTGFHTALRENHRLRSSLEPAIVRAERATERFLDILKSRIIETPLIDIEPAELYGAATASINANFALYDTVAAELDNLLKMRIARLTSKRNIAGLTGVAALLMIIYIFTAFYNSVVPPLQNLADISHAIAAGNYSRKATVNSSDELGYVSEAFNRIAESVQNKISQLTVLQEAVSDIASHLEMGPLLEVLAQRAAILLRAELSAIIILDPETGGISHFKTNIPPESFPVKKTPEGRGLWSVVIRDGVSLRLDDIAKHPRYEGLPPEHPPIKNLLGVPMLLNGQTIGGLFVANKSGSDIFSQTDEELLLTLAFQTVSAVDNARLHAAVNELATRDSLTGLYNRRALKERLNEEANRIRRYRHPLSIMMLDIDYFKKTNDTYGHQAGDAVLQQAAQRLLQQVRVVDIVARYGGEEFAITLPETSVENAKIVGERIRNAMAETGFILPDGNKINITASIGIAASKIDKTQTPEELLEEADKALYTAKQSGRNRVCIFHI